MDKEILDMIDSELKLRKDDSVSDTTSENSDTVSNTNNEQVSPSRLPSIEAARQRTLERGELDLGKTLDKFTQEGAIPKVIASLELASDPFKRIEAAMANPLLAMQEGKFGLEGSALGGVLTNSSIPNAIVQGLRGKKVGEFGDVYVGAGVPENQAKVLGLATDILIGGKVLDLGIKGVLKGVRHLQDVKLLKSVDDLLEGTEKAQEASRQMTNHFWKDIDKVPVDANEVINTVSNLPKTAVDIIEFELGKKVEEISNLSDLRKTKQIIAELRSNAFAKSERGLEATRDEKLIIRAYAQLSNLIKKTLKGANLGDKADELIKVNDAAENVISASKYVKRTLSGQQGERKVANALAKIKDVGGEELRNRLDVLSKTGYGAKSQINKGINIITKIAGKIGRRKLVSNLLKSATYGGIAGSIGAAAARKILMKNEGYGGDSGLSNQ